MKLIALRPVLYLAHQYRTGDELPVNNPVMTAAWLDAESAEWQEDDASETPAPTVTKAEPAAAEPGIEGRSDGGNVLQGKVPETPERKKPQRKAAAKKTS